MAIAYNLDIIGVGETWLLPSTSDSFVNIDNYDQLIIRQFLNFSMHIYINIKFARTM